METLEKIIDLVTEKEKKYVSEGSSDSDAIEDFVSQDIDDLFRKCKTLTKKIYNIEDRLEQLEDGSHCKKRIKK